MCNCRLRRDTVRRCIARFILNSALVEDKHSDEQTEQFPANDCYLVVSAAMLNVYSWPEYCPILLREAAVASKSITLMLFWRSGPRFGALSNCRLVAAATPMSPSTSGLR